MSSTLSQGATTDSAANATSDADRRSNHLLHLIALLHAELDGVAPGVLPPGATLNVPSSPLPVPDEGEEARPTFACSACGMLNNPGIHHPMRFYAVTQGWAVGVVQGSTNAHALTTGVRGGLKSKGASEYEAVTIFNNALACSQVHVVPKSL